MVDYNVTVLEKHLRMKEEETIYSDPTSSYLPPWPPFCHSHLLICWADQNSAHPSLFPQCLYFTEGLVGEQCKATLLLTSLQEVWV